VKSAFVLAAVTIALSSSLVRPAHAEPIMEVLVAEAEEEMGARVAAELTSMGIEARAARTVNAPLLSVAIERRMLLAMKLVRRGGEIEITVADRLTGKTLMRALPIQQSDSANTIALRSVELLRASLLDFAAARSNGPGVLPLDAIVAPSAPPATSANVTSTVTRPTNPPQQRTAETRRQATETASPRFAVELGPSVDISPGSFSPFISLRGFLGLEIVKGVRAGVAGAITCLPAGIETPDFYGTINAYSIGADGRYEFLDGSWRPSLGLNASVLHAVTFSVPRTAWVFYREDNLTTFSGSVRPGFAWVPNEFVSVRTDVALGFVAESIVIGASDGDNDVYQRAWGRLWLSPSISLEAHLF
jgi:hypothetical protein